MCKISSFSTEGWSVLIFFITIINIELSSLVILFFKVSFTRLQYKSNIESWMPGEKYYILVV